MKIKVLILAALAMFLLQSFSPWEGAAGVAPAGELPVNGFFVSTNSFPRNTVVDLTNLETGRTTRAIVAGTLNNPGLLAVVSRDAAELIGMRQGSISRIRIISPADPIAYQRFQEGIANEMPPFDSGSVLRNENELLADVYGRDSFNPNQSSQNPVESEFTGPRYLMEPEWGGGTRLEIVDVPRFQEPPPPPAPPSPPTPPPPPSPPSPPPPPIEYREDVVKAVPGYLAEQAQPSSDKIAENFYPEADYAEAVKSVPSYTSDTPSAQASKKLPEYAPESIYSEIAKNVEGFISNDDRLGNAAKDVPRFTADRNDLQAAAKAAPAFTPESFGNRIAKDVPVYSPEAPFNEIAKKLDGYNPESANNDIVKARDGFIPEQTIGDAAKDVERFRTEQTNERVAKFTDGFETEKALEELAKDVRRFEAERIAEAKAKDVEGFLSERSVDDVAKAIEGFMKESSPAELAKAVPGFAPEGSSGAVAKSVPPFNIVQSDERSPGSVSGVYGIDPNDIIPGIAIPARSEREKTPVRDADSRPAAAPSTSAVQPAFSIRSINALDRGQYYVQLASTQVNMVENTIKQFEPQFFSYNPVVFKENESSYRIMIGPLNQGESAAILARFKSLGYRDAFVRRGG